ncbi:MAG: 2-phosphoglycerate kinase [Theionarchaea archaeon]|nr:2-phosphoglycerate kinase [Theionarchaea archaeon]MBU6999741.1 2-phosphoglycerate kinase [Theionarchaea archaeon]MBU7020162.1 2-phosphoglycerate kinase [Theionarchaea archaeon]MBU7033721.1 2-phosphoglycerate kinase [Theionarchaea archaeon]MBU7039968.1 2-phosphoglycerate kinase [Theionarchaea archaeon]
MIDVVGKKYTTPFSKGILAGSLLKAGLDVDKAYRMAEEIGQKIVSSGVSSISEQDLTDMTHQLLLDDGYPRIASYYEMWHSLRKKKQSLVILLGGATGIGKSTVAFEISYRLGIHSIIGTDVVREVMRKMVSRDLLPTLHTSSFSAWKEIQAPSSFLSAVIYAFELQVSHVSVGVNAIINRALTEGFSLVMEGIHLVPGYIEPRDQTIFHFVLTLNDREEHISRFHARAKDSRRPPEHYIKDIDEIRQIQDHIVGRANKERVPVLENITLEETVTQILNRMYDRLQKEAVTDE